MSRIINLLESTKSKKPYSTNIADRVQSIKTFKEHQLMQEVNIQNKLCSENKKVMGYVDMRDYSRKMMSDAALAAAR